MTEGDIRRFVCEAVAAEMPRLKAEIAASLRPVQVSFSRGSVNVPANARVSRRG